MINIEMIPQNNSLTIDSREVAKMVNVNHWEILRKLEGSKDRKGYIEILNNNQMVVAKYFIKSEYRDEKGENRPCYLFTKMGCEMLANKLTGERGILFTAKYVERFNQMESVTVKPLSTEDVLIRQLEEQKKIKSRLSIVESKVDNQITIDHGQQRIIQREVGRKVYERIRKNFVTDLGLKENLVYSKTVKRYFNALYREIKNRFGVSSYRDIKAKDFTTTINYIQNWVEDCKLREI